MENIIERAIILCESGIVHAEDLPLEVAEHARPSSKNTAVHEEGLRHMVTRSTELAEKELLQKALREAGNNRAQAAHLLKIGRTSLYRKMKKFGLK